MVKGIHISNVEGQGKHKTVKQASIRKKINEHFSQYMRYASERKLKGRHCQS